MTDPNRKMSELARSFPCLRNAPGIDPWDAQVLDRWAAGSVSHGEQVTARFLLAVWDASAEWQSGRFDLMEALHVWEPSHRLPFLEWADDPWWP